MICTQRERSEPSIYIYRKQILEELKKKKAQPSSLSLGEVSVGDVLTVTRLRVSVRTHSAMRPVLHGAGRAARTQKHSVLFLTCCAARRRGVGGPAHVGGMAALIYGIGAWAEATAYSRASSHATWSLASWAPTRLLTWGAVSWGRGLQRRCLGTAGSSGARGKAVFSRPPGTDVCPGSRGGGCHCTRVWCTLPAFKRRPRGEGARSLRGSRKGRCGFTSKQ